ncbi:MAG: carboxypeptidase-like regulatory domain-containing protein [Saprospiraceae bacterium]
MFTNAQVNTSIFPTETFRGVLYDLQTGQHLEGASISIECDQISVTTMTDDSGYFTLSGAPKSCFKVKISMSGFEDKVLENINRVQDVEYYIGLEQKKVQQPKNLN